MPEVAKSKIAGLEHYLIDSYVKIMFVRGMGIRDISVMLHISITKVLKVLKSAHYKIKPKVSHYDCLEIDEFWTYVGKKENKVWLIYAYHRESGEIVASNRRFSVWGKRDIKTAKKLRRRIKRLGIRYERMAADGRRQANGTRLNTGCFRLSARTGRGYRL
jgi:hypothetical protein